MIYDSFSESDTFNIAKNLGENAKQGEVYCLSGELGSGKTIFAKGFANGLGVDGLITSPTFTIINQYNGRLPLYHFDVYRINSIYEMYELGYEEYFYVEGVCLIEWADIIKQIIPVDAIWIKIQKDIGNVNCRKIEVLK